MSDCHFGISPVNYPDPDPDQHLAKDDLMDSLEKFEDFEGFKRAHGQSINEYVAVFDAKYIKIEKKKMTLPAEILAFKLLRKANITKEEKLLVLTGMNYDNKETLYETLYEKAKKSLKKFKGSDGESCNSGSSIKMEPAFLAANEEALLAAGYTTTRGNSRGIGRDSGETWRHGRPGKGEAGGEFPRTEFRSQAARGGGYQHTDLGSQVSQPSDRNRKNINPTGPDGRTLM